MSEFDEELNSMDESKPNSGGNNWNKGNNFNKDNGGKPAWKKDFSKFKKDDTPKVFSLYKPYVVTGNKEAPPSIVAELESLVKRIEALGYTTRTGGLDGVDSAVEKVSTKLELYLPWKGFAEKESKLYWNDDLAMQAAKKYSPVFDNLKPVVQAFLAKNARMVLGTKFDSNALFLLCWSDDGAEAKKDVTSRTGNVGHVILIANSIGIPIFNLGNEDTKQRLYNYLSLFEQE